MPLLSCGLQSLYCSPTSDREGKEGEQWFPYSPIIVLTGKVQLSMCCPSPKVGVYSLTDSISYL